MDAPLILTPAIALHQDGQVHTVEFLVRAWGDHIDAAEKVVAVTLWDGPPTFTRTGDAEFATIHVSFPVALADQFRSDTGQALGRHFMGKLVRVRGLIKREKLAVESIDGSPVQHARVQIEVTDLNQIEVVSARPKPAGQDPPPKPAPISPEVARARQEREAAAQKFKEELTGTPAPPLDPGRWVTPGVELERLTGKVVLLDFWGRWCGPCVRKLPRVEELHAKYQGRGLIVLGVHTPDEDVRLDEFLKEKQVTFPVMVDTGKTAERYHIQGWPTYFLIDKAGKLAWGCAHAPPTEEQIEALLGQQAAP